MIITVECTSGMVYDLSVRRSATVTNVKEALAEKEAPVDQQRLIFEGRQLEEGRTLADYNIRAGSVLYMILRLRGC